MFINEYDTYKANADVQSRSVGYRDWHDDKWMEMNIGELPKNVVDKLLTYNEGNDIDEVTTPVPGDAVYVYNVIDYPQIGEVVSAEDDGKYYVCIDGEIISSGLDDLNIIRSGYLPTADKFFYFKDQILNRWMEHGGYAKLSNLGFRVYESEDFGYVFSTDEIDADKFLSSVSQSLKETVDDGKITKEDLYV